MHVEQRAKELENVFHQIRRKGMGFQCISDLKNSERHFLWLLASLSKETGYANPSELANRLDVTMAAVSHHINALEAKGYIERSVSEKDRREVLIKITAEGNKKIKNIKDIYWHKMCEIVEYIGDEDSAKLIEIIKKIDKFMITSQDNN